MSYIPTEEEYRSNNIPTIVDLLKSIEGEAYLVGSIVKRDYNKNSDIDIYVRTSQDLPDEVEFKGVMREVDCFTHEDIGIESYRKGLEMFPEAKLISVDSFDPISNNPWSYDLKSDRFIKYTNHGIN